MKLPTKLISGLKTSLQKIQQFDRILGDPIRSQKINDRIGVVGAGILGIVGLDCVGRLLYRESQNQQAVKTLVKQDYQKVGMSQPKDIMFKHGSIGYLVEYLPEKDKNTVFVDNSRVTRLETPAERVSQYERERFKRKVDERTKNDPRGPVIKEGTRNFPLDVAANNVEWHFRAKYVPNFKKKYPNPGTFEGDAIYNSSYYATEYQKARAESAKKGYPLETPEMFVKRVYP
ncbi:MAG: hypothetical protein ACKO37_03810 [Vampirovibrionales bacterium]